MNGAEKNEGKVPTPEIEDTVVIKSHYRFWEGQRQDDLCQSGSGKITFIDRLLKRWRLAKCLGPACEYSERQNNK